VLFQSPIQWVPGCLLGRGLQRLGREDDPTYIVFML
jgi:hypothetical protein